MKKRRRYHIISHPAFSSLLFVISLVDVHVHLSLSAFHCREREVRGPTAPRTFTTLPLTALLLKQNREDDSSSTPHAIQPPPLYIPPSRARRRFAARLAERQRARQEADGADLDADEEHTIDLDDAEGHDPDSDTLPHRRADDAEEHEPGLTTVDHEDAVDLGDEKDEVEFESPEGTEFEAGMSPVKRNQAAAAGAGTGRQTGPARFSGLFASDSDSDSDGE